MWKAEFECWSDLFEDCYDPMQKQMQDMIDMQQNYAEMCGIGASAGGATKKKKSSTKDGTKKKTKKKSSDPSKPKKKKKAAA